MGDIKDIVNDVIRDLERKKTQHQKDIHLIWRSCVKAKEAEHTKIEGIRDGVLHVNVDCSAWMFQCRLRYKTILQNIQKEFPEIKRIYFKVGKIL